MIIAFTGKAGSGKNEAAKCLGELLPIKQYAMADKLKCVALSLGWNGEKDKKGRKFLQELGQCARNYDENVWVDMVINQIKEFNKVGLPHIDVITDIRFPNEIKQLENAFGDITVIRLTGRQADLGDNAKDISENALEDFRVDYEISNTSSLEYLKLELQRIIVQELE